MANPTERLRSKKVFRPKLIKIAESMFFGDIGSESSLLEVASFRVGAEWKDVARAYKIWQSSPRMAQGHDAAISKLADFLSPIIIPKL